MLLRALSKLPLAVLYSLSSIIYIFTYYVVRYRIAVTRKNLSSAFPELSQKQQRTIEKRYYRCFIDSLFETIHAYSMSDQEIAQRVHFDATHILKEQLKRRQSIILLTAHLGNLEWLLHATQSKIDVAIDPVYRPAHNHLVDHFIFDVRSGNGGTPIPYKTMAKDFLLRQDIARCIAIPADLRPRSRERTIDIKFLNRTTRFFFSIERLVRRYQIPVIFIYMHRTGRGKYEVRCELMSDGSSQMQHPGDLTKQYAKLVEQQIYTQPESWLWSHRRWKTRSAR